jgi:hypothetical protein
MVKYEVTPVFLDVLDSGDQQNFRVVINWALIISMFPEVQIMLW